MNELRSVFKVNTPEHVSLNLTLAELGTRIVACTIDFALVSLASIILAFTIGQMLWFRNLRDVAWALILLVIFLLRTFYFMVGETRGHGQTFGKKKMGLRVVAADGGPLTVEQIVARNFTRELEIFLPLSLLATSNSLTSEAPAWARAGLVLWTIGLISFPFLNRRRARIGDLIAGTVVIAEPGIGLDLDLADSGAVQPDFQFTQAQLDIYGIKELQVLEDVLRRPDSTSRSELLRQILERVIRKIEWPDSVPYIDAERYLQAFYAAQRHRLEHQMLLGERREEKIH